ncbi:transmembrane protein 200C-like [Scleropages formosus]|uniref:Transmembrane protein 200C-like n=1 Tax=Scleropages formosus TaxID=113540 RepID=A0A8C9RPU0_SCLFO|nr:transmembrane protein 200C-like [Scleropages formosus]
MIATGGLLRIAARRQESLRCKSRTESQQQRRKAKKKKRKKKKKTDVVVVRGKLQLCSTSGLVAVVGLLVLTAGVAMAVLGYWPQERPARPLMPSHSLLPKSTGIYDQGLSTWNQTQDNAAPQHANKGLHDRNQSSSPATGTLPAAGFFTAFMATHLNSERLKVFGPLTIGIGIFIFICANAVLHENRDRKTKIIDLRDIYTTVIDLHGARTKEHTPLNGFLGHGSSSPYGTAMPTRSSWPSTLWDRQPEAWYRNLAHGQSFGMRHSPPPERETPTSTVYSIYQEHSQIGGNTPERGLREVSTATPPVVGPLTLPAIKVDRCTGGHGPPGRAQGEDDCGNDGTTPQMAGGKDSAPADLPRTVSVHLADKVHSYKSSSSLQGALEGSQVQLLPPSPHQRLTGSHVSLGALSDRFSSGDLAACPSAPSGQGCERVRRFSCPRLDLGSRGYVKLEACERDPPVSGDADDAP